MMLVIALALFVAITAWIFFSFPTLERPLALAGSLASTAALFPVLKDILSGLHDSFQEARGVLEPLKRLISPTIYAVLGLTSSGFLLYAVFSLFSQPSPLTTVSPKLHFLFLAFPFVVFLALMYKVRAHRTLDLQKRAVQTLLQKVTAQRASERPNSADQDRKANFLSFLEDVCRNALRATAVAGNQQRSALDGLTAVLFLADSSKASFRAVTVAEGVPEYDKLLRTFFPPFLDIDFVRKCYSDLHLEAAKAPRRRGANSARERFLEQTKDSISVCGISYALNKRIAVRNTRNCLIFRSEVFSRLSAEDQRKFQLGQVIALPIHTFGHRSGILLLMAAKGRRFYTSDSIYVIVSRLVGLALEIGVDLQYFSDFVPADFLEKCLLEEEPSATESAAIIKMINQIRSDFSNVLDGEMITGATIDLSNHDQGVYELQVVDTALEVILFNARLAFLSVKLRRLKHRQ